MAVGTLMLLTLVDSLVYAKEQIVSGSDVANPNPPENAVRITRFRLATCYVAGILFPLAYLTSEPYKRDRLLRFHSFQSIMFFVILFLVRLASLLSPLALRIEKVIQLGFVLTWLVLMISVYSGKTIKLPFIGRWAERTAG